MKLSPSNLTSQRARAFRRSATLFATALVTLAGAERLAAAQAPPEGSRRPEASPPGDEPSAPPSKAAPPREDANPAAPTQREAGPEAPPKKEAEPGPPPSKPEAQPKPEPGAAPSETTPPNDPASSNPAPSPTEPPRPSAPEPPPSEAGAEHAPDAAPPADDTVEAAVDSESATAPEDDAQDDAEDDGDVAEDEVELLVAGTSASRVAGSVHVIGPETLERMEYDDPHAVLRQVPGVYLREEDGVGLRPNIAMRGVNPDRSKKVTLMEDGVLFGPAPYSAPAAYYFPMMTRMSQVHVIKGPSAIAFGPQTVGGAIDLITRPVPVVPTAYLDVGYGQYGYRKAHAYAGYGNGQYGLLLEGVHVGNDGFKTLPDGANTGASRNEWMAKGSYLVDPMAEVTNELSIKASYSDEASNETYLGLTDDDFDENPNQRYPASALDRMDNHRTAFALTHELNSYDQGLNVRTTVYRNDFFRVWRKFNRLGGTAAGPVLANPDDPSNAAYYAVLAGLSDTSGPLDTLWVGPNQREFVSQGITSRFRIGAVTGPVTHKLETGLRLHHDSSARDHSEEAFAMVDGELVSASQPRLTTTLDFASTHALAAHVTDAMTFGPLTVTPGLRMETIYSVFEDYLADTNDERALVALMPGVGVYYALADYWGALAGAYRGFSPPPPGSDETIEPEYSINYEVGTRYASWPTRLELIGFFNDYSNLTDICTFSSGCLDEDLGRQFDAGSAHVYGLEALAAHHFEAGSLTFPVSGAYTLSYGEFRSSFDSADPIYGMVTAGDEIPYLPRHQLTAQLACEHERFGAYVAGTYVSPVREQAGSQPLDQVSSTDPLVTLDVGVSVKVLGFASLYLNARNLLGYQGIVAHRPFGARPNAPFWIQGGLKVELEKTPTADAGLVGSTDAMRM